MNITQHVNLGYGWTGEENENVDRSLGYPGQIAKAISRKDAKELQVLLDKYKPNVSYSMGTRALKFFDLGVMNVLNEYHRKKDSEGAPLFRAHFAHQIIQFQCPTEALDFLIDQEQAYQKLQLQRIQEPNPVKPELLEEELNDDDDDNLEDLFYSEQDPHAGFYFDYLKETYPWLLREHYYGDKDEEEHPWRSIYLRYFLKKEAQPYIEHLNQVFPNLKNEVFSSVESLHSVLKQCVADHDDQDAISSDVLKELQTYGWRDVFLNLLYDQNRAALWEKDVFLRLIELLDEHPFLQNALNEAQHEADRILSAHQHYFDTWLPLGIPLEQSPFYKNYQIAETKVHPHFNNYYTVDLLTQEAFSTTKSAWGIKNKACPSQVLWDKEERSVWENIPGAVLHYAYETLKMPPMPIVMHRNFVELLLHKKVKETVVWMMGSESGKKALNQALKDPQTAAYVSENIGFKGFVALLEAFPDLLEVRTCLGHNLGVHVVGRCGLASNHALQKLYQKAPKWFEDDELFRTFKHQGMSEKTIADFEAKTIKSALRKNEDVRAKIDKRKPTSPKRRL